MGDCAEISQIVRLSRRRDPIGTLWNHSSHFFTQRPLPPAQYLAKFPNYSDIEPPWDSFDLSLSYNAGDRPANTYLKNILLTFNINDLLDKHASLNITWSAVATGLWPSSTARTNPMSGASSA